MSALHAQRYGGAGAPVVCLHGFLGRGADWRRAADALGRPVLAVDLPGHGASVSLPAESYTFGGWADALARTLDAHGIDRAPMLGYSMGGRLALAFALARPDRVRALVLEGATAGIDSAADRADRLALDDARAAALEADLDAFLEAWYRMPLFQTLAPDARDTLRAQRALADPAELARALRGLGTGRMPPLWDALAAFSRPLVAVAGARDAKFVALAQRLANTAPLGRAVLVPGAGHNAHLERPDAFWAAVRPHLNPEVAPSHG